MTDAYVLEWHTTTMREPERLYFKYRASADRGNNILD